jgi:hypothetical protein
MVDELVPVNLATLSNIPVPILDGHGLTDDRDDNLQLVKRQLVGVVIEVAFDPTFRRSPENVLATGKKRRDVEIGLRQHLGRRTILP